MPTNKTPSLEYLEELLIEAKTHLPSWLYTSLMSAARARAGGRSSHRALSPSVIERIALAGISEAAYKDASDSDLKEVWGQLSQWYAGAKKARNPIEFIVSAALITRKEMARRKLGVAPGPLVEATAEFEALTKSDEGLVRGDPEIPATGPLNARVAFVEASLDPMERARGEQLVGPVGVCFIEKYLRPLGLDREDVLLMALVPTVLKSLDGARREPRTAELAVWKDAQLAVIDTAAPTVVVALGRTVGASLGERADFVLPHPSAVARFGDSGEVARKVKRIGELIEKRARIFKALSTKLVKSEGGADGEEAWLKDWHKQMSRSGEGRFSYQHHWRGLLEDEIGMTDEELMLKTEHSVHGDLRIESDDGLWGFAVFLGDTDANRALVHNDRLIDWDTKKRLEVRPKLNSPKEWLDVGSEKPFVSRDTDAETFAKFFLNDTGSFQLGVVKKESVEIFLDGDHLSGRYLLSSAPFGDKRRWLIDRPKNQTPIAETNDLADVLREQRIQKAEFLVWSAPGQKPRIIDVLSEQVEKANEPVSISKADPIKRIVYGVVLDPYGKNGAEADAHDEWPTPAMVEQAAHEFAVGPCVIGLQHGKKANAQLVETSVEQYPSRKDYLAAMSELPHRVYRRKFGDDVIHSGSWVVGVRLGPKEWKMYEDGELTAFSPGGFGIKVPITRAELPEVTFVDLEEKVTR